MRLHRVARFGSLPRFNHVEFLTQGHLYISIQNIYKTFIKQGIVKKYKSLKKTCSPSQYRE